MIHVNELLCYKAGGPERSVRPTSRHEQAYRTSWQSRTTTPTGTTNADPIKLPKSTVKEIMKLAKHRMVGMLFTDKATASTTVEKVNMVNDAIAHATVHIVGAGGRCSLHFESSHSVTDSLK